MGRNTCQGRIKAMSYRKDYWLASTGRHLRKDIEVTVHAERAMEDKKRMNLKGASYTDLKKIAAEAWESQRGPDPAWNVPRVDRRFRYIGYKDYVMVFEIVNREHLVLKSLKRLVTVVGPFKEGDKWEDHYKENRGLR